MFGDWGGERTRLEQMGITFYGEYRDDFQGNVTGTDKNGNERDHSVNFGIFYLNLDVDLMKLADTFPTDTSTCILPPAVSREPIANASINSGIEHTR